MIQMDMRSRLGDGEMRQDALETVAEFGRGYEYSWFTMDVSVGCDECVVY